MNPFKIGDRARAMKEAPYSITTGGWTGKVTRVEGRDIYVVEAPKISSMPYDTSDGYQVDSRWFVKTRCLNNNRKKEEE